MTNEAGAFPSVHWESLGGEATFLPGDILPEASQGHLWAVLTFVFYGDRIALADIPGRGYCVPSGRIEPGELIADAALREVYEETGVRIKADALRLIGCFRLGSAEDDAKYCPTFIAEALGFESLPEGTEARAMLLCPIEDVAGLYYVWDRLLDAVFEYAASQRHALPQPGLQISELTGDPEV